MSLSLLVVAGPDLGRRIALREVPISIGRGQSEALRLAMNMACTLFRLTPEEALRGTTVNAAKALGLADRGRLAPGMRADFVIWNAGKPADLCYWIGGSLAENVFARGNALRRWPS